MHARHWMTLALAFSAAPAPGADDRPDRFGPDPDTKAVQARIAAELEGLAAHPWAGRYAVRPGLGGAGLELAPRAGFTLEVSSCFDASWMHGAVTQAGVRLLLKGAPGPAPQGEPVPDLVFVPVTWGQRRYLLRESEVFFFCRYVADGRGNETMARHLLREGDEKRPSSGLPRTLDGAPLCETPPVKRD